MDKKQKSFADRISDLRFNYMTIEKTIESLNQLNGVQGSINRIVVETTNYTKVLVFPAGSYMEWSALTYELLKACEALMIDYNYDMQQLLKELSATKELYQGKE